MSKPPRPGSKEWRNADEDDIVNPHRIRDDGEHIEPIPGDPVCDDYDAAGAGAMDADGCPQCAWCGWPKSFHALFAEREK
jgi:hypothetical protein